MEDDRYIQMALSKDGARTFSAWRARAVPDWGDYSDPMPTWRRMGTARQAVPKFRFTEHATITIIALEAQGE